MKNQQEVYPPNVENLKAWIYLAMLVILAVIVLMMLPSEPNNRLPQTSAAAEGAK